MSKIEKSKFADYIAKAMYWTVVVNSLVGYLSNPNLPVFADILF